jgi:divalent metal cation (Fe/Co/Zn/Cd) transporter
MTVRDSHAIADELEHELRTAARNRINISIHIEPHGDHDASDHGKRETPGS